VHEEAEGPGGSKKNEGQEEGKESGSSGSEVEQSRRETRRELTEAERRRNGRLRGFMNV